MNISRRQMLKLGLLGTAGASLLGTGALFPRRAVAASTFTGAYYIPPSYQALSYGPDGFVKILKESLGDALKVAYYNAAQLLKDDEQLPALRAGSIDFMFHTTSYITRSAPILGITGLPGVVEELHLHPERLVNGSPLFELINEELAKINLHMVSAGGILEPEYLWSTKASPIRSLADLKGKKVRVVSFEATSVLEKMGAAAIRIPSSETYLALQRGTIDAGVFNISTVNGRSLQEQLGYCYKLPLTAYAIVPFVLRKRWDKFDATTKGALQKAGAWYDENFVKNANQDFYPNTLWPKVKAAGVEVIEPGAADQAAFNDATQAVWDHWKGQVGEKIGSRAIALALGKA